MGTCEFEPPDHVPRTSARAHTCAVVFRRAPCVPRSREHDERPAAGRGKNADVPKKTHFYVVIEGSPSGCVWREIPGVTQVNEKGHEGNTAVVTAYSSEARFPIDTSQKKSSCVCSTNLGFSVRSANRIRPKNGIPMPVYIHS